MRVLFLHKYGAKAASFRYRFGQYFPHLERRGIVCESSSLFDDAYLETRFASGRRSIGGALRAVVGRLRAFAGIKRFDLVVIGLEFLPYVPPVFERLMAAIGVPFVLDYDDAVFHYYDKHRCPVVRSLLGRKTAEVCRLSSRVFAGSPYLVSYAARAGAVVEYLPTVVDLEKYRDVKAVRSRGERFTVGWMGSPTTAQYLHLIAPALREFCAERRARFVVIGAGLFEMEGVDLEVRPWRAHREVEDLLGFDVGLMPLANDRWARGKCGFKLIQYMACGLPVVASPVGVNSAIVVEGTTGFLARSQSDWKSALTRLHDDVGLAERMGREGRRRVVNEYCVQRTLDRLVAGLREAAGSVTAGGTPGRVEGASPS